MTNASDYERLSERISAIPPDELRHPNLPMGVFLQEVEDLIAWAEVDREALLAVGLEPGLLDELPARVGAARQAQSRWNSARFSREDAQEEFARRAPDAFDLRDRLVHHLLFAYRRQPDLLRRVRAIAEGAGHADLIQDLSDLAVHGRVQPAALAAIGCDVALLDEAARTSDELGTLLGVAHGEEAVGREAKRMRDAAYTLVKRAVDEIRANGQYVFWRDEARRRGYTSSYWRQRRRRARAAGNAPVATADAP